MTDDANRLTDLYRILAFALVGGLFWWWWTGWHDGQAHDRTKRADLSNDIGAVEAELESVRIEYAEKWGRMDERLRNLEDR